jgi:hypothetical protein
MNNTKSLVGKLGTQKERIQQNREREIISMRKTTINWNNIHDWSINYVKPDRL